MTAKTSTAVLLLAGCAARAAGAGAAAGCGLPGAVLPADRVNITVAGQEVPFGVSPLGWTSATIGAFIGKILLEEILGYNTVITEVSQSSFQGMLRVAGCLNPQDGYDAICGDPFSATHFTWESWVLSDSYDPLKGDLDGIMPIDLGSTGYDGIETAFVMQAPLAAAYAEKGLDLEWHRNWNVSWHESSAYFARISDYPEEELMACKDSKFAWESIMLKYVEFTGDTDGVEVVDDAGVQETWAKCTWGGQQTKWWLAPACRNAPETCVPLIMGGNGWSMESFMQKATTINAPWALAVAIDWSRYVSLPKQYQSVFSWWEPDASFVSQAPQRIMFQARDPEAWAVGDVRTDVGTSKLLKWLHWSIPQAAPMAYELLGNIQVSINTMRPLLMETLDGSSNEEVACNFLKQNQDVWEPWIPDATTCVPGMGLISQSGEFQDDRGSSSNCYWCSVGRFSEPIIDDKGTTHRCVACTQGRFQSMPGQMECTDCQSGSFQDVAGQSFCAECAAGTYQDVPSQTVCPKCTAGTISSPGSSECTDCQEGRFQDVAGQSVCAKCAAGTYQNQKGQTGCPNCTAGTMTSSAGSSECSACMLGTTSSSGQSMCTLCDSDSYTKTIGASSCTACPAGLVTESKGSASAEACVCPEGSFLPWGQETGCSPCPEGMGCPLGSDMTYFYESGSSIPHPVTLPGFMTLSSDPLTVYLCINSEHCPGGDPGACAELRDGAAVACGACGEEAYESGGECIRCDAGGGGQAPWIFVGLAAMGGLVLYVLSVSQHVQQNRHAGIFNVVLVGLTVSGMQALGIFKNLALKWLGAAKGILDSMQFFTFDLSVFKIGCSVGTDAVTNYAVRQFVAPLSIIGILATLVCKKHCRDRTMNLGVEVVNAIGAVFNVFFIAIIVSCMLPLICYDHPGGNSQSMRSNPSILCFDGSEHALMLTIGIIAFLLVPVPFAALAIYSTAKYPEFSLKYPEKLQAFRFLFMRFQPAAYYYGLVMLSKSLIICLIPVLMRDTAVQVLLLLTTICGYALAQVFIRPWRWGVTNVIDGALSTCLVILLAAGALGTGLQASEEAISIMGAMSLILFLGIVGLALSANVSYFCMISKRILFFICYHRGQAGAQARLLRLHLVEHGVQSVSLDDEVCLDIEDAIDVVKSRIRNLVVYLTRDTLRDPWCVCQIVTPCMYAGFCEAAVQTIGVFTPTFTALTKEQMDKIPKYVDMAQSCFARYGIKPVHVQTAFATLLDAGARRIDLPAGGLPDAGAASCFLHVASALLLGGPRGQGGATTGSGFAAVIPTTAQSVVISADHGSAEAIAAAELLIFKMKGQIESIYALTKLSASDTKAIGKLLFQARGVIVLLSYGSLLSLDQLAPIAELMRARAAKKSTCDQVVIPMTLPGFEPPGENYYTSILPSILQTNMHERVTQSVLALFEAAMRPLAVSGPLKKLDSQIQEVLTLIPTASGNSTAEELVQACETNALDEIMENRFQYVTFRSFTV